MLIVALVLAVIGLAALVTAVVTSNEIVAWVCIGASALGVLLLVIEAIRERQQRRAGDAVAAGIATAETDLPDADEATEFVIYDGHEPESEQVTMESEQQAEIDTEVVVEDDPDEEADLDEEIAAEDHPEEVIHDEPEYDTYSDDEQEFPDSAEEAALHTVEAAELETTESDER